MLEDGTDYKKIKKVIMINILDYILYKEHKEYISKTAIVLDKHREHEVIKEISWYFIELPKFTKAKEIDIEDTVNQWIAFFSNDRRYVKMLAEKKEIFKEARKEVEYLTGDAETRRLQELRDKWEMDRISEINYATEQGKKIGEKRGERRGKINIAKRLLAMGYDIEQVKNMTELTRKEINKLKEQI